MCATLTSKRLTISGSREAVPPSGSRGATNFTSCAARSPATRSESSPLDAAALRDGGRRPRRDDRSGALGLVAVPAAELLYPPGRVEDARLPGVERVARRRDLDVDDGISLAVLPGDGALARGSRPGEESEVRRAVAEDDRTVVRVDSLLHGYRSSLNSTCRRTIGSYLRTTRRSGSFLRLFVVTYV